MRIFHPILCLLGLLISDVTRACCAFSMKGDPVINADQTVILWDQDQQMEHFIRKANFRSKGESVGFLVPSPSRPQLEASGNAAFPYLEQITTPPPQRRPGSPLVAPLRHRPSRPTECG